MRTQSASSLRTPCLSSLNSLMQRPWGSALGTGDSASNGDLLLETIVEVSDIASQNGQSEVDRNEAFERLYKRIENEGADPETLLKEASSALNICLLMVRLRT